MEVLLFIVGSVFLIILITGYFGIGIKASLINEIRRQAYMGSVATLKSYPSISIEEAYNALSSYDTTGKGNSIDSFGKWSFWVLVNGSPYVILIKKESFSSGIKLLVTSGEDYIDRMNNNYLYVNNKFIEEYDLIPSDIKSI